MIRLERSDGGGLGSGSWNVSNRGRPSVAVDLKHADGREALAGSLVQSGRKPQEPDPRP